MDFEPWSPSPLLREFNLDIDSQQHPFNLDLFRAEGEIKIEKVLPSEQCPVPTTKENVLHFDRDLEPQDFDSTTPELSETADSVDGRESEGEGQVRTVNPACLVRRIETITPTIQQPSSESASGPLQSQETELKHPSRRSTLTILEYQPKPTPTAHQSSPSTNTISKKEHEIRLAVVKHNSEKRNEVRKSKIRTPIKLEPTNDSPNHSRRQLSSEVLSSSSTDVSSRSFEECCLVLNYNGGKGIRKKRKATLDDKKSTARTRAEGGQCVRCRIKKRKCGLKDDVTGACKSCVCASQKVPNLTIDMCIRITPTFLLREDLGSQAITTPIPGADTYAQSLQLLDTSWKNHYPHPPPPLTRRIFVTLEKYRLGRPPKAQIVLDLMHVAPTFNRPADSNQPPIPLRPFQTQRPASQNLLLGPTRPPPQNLPYFETDWSVIPKGSIPSGETMITHFWAQLWATEGVYTGDEHYLFKFGAFLVTALGTQASTGMGRLIKHTIDLALATNFRGCIFLMNRNPAPVKIRNFIISEQLWQTIEPYILNCENIVLQQLRVFTETSTGGKLDNYMPIFTCICILFLMYSRASMRSLGPNCILGSPIPHHDQLKSSKFYCNLEERRTRAALQTCKELAKLYLALFHKTGPFEWANDRQKDWNPFESWLRKQGCDSTLIQTSTSFLKAYVAETTMRAKAVKVWRPGCPFHPNYLEQILRYSI